jgi:protein gp37
MAEKTIIAWTGQTWNPWRGCTKVSPGCKNCYMFTAQERYGKDPSQVVRTKTWGDPLRWQKAAAAAGRSELVFTCSWSDWFHVDADPWRGEAWSIVRRCPNLTFQILTKRADRIAANLPPDWGQGYPNVWLGVSVENRKHGLPRIDHLRPIPAAVRFLSVEPLLEDLGAVNLDRVDWVIVGGESGPGFRPMEHDWARSLRGQCQAAGVAYFFKQSSAPRTETGIELDGKIVREYPTPRRVELATVDLFGGN